MLVPVPKANDETIYLYCKGYGASAKGFVSAGAKNENIKDQQRLGQLKNLVMLASADEKITDSELAVLVAVASRENITPEEFNKVIEDPDSVTITLPEDEETKLAYLRDMVAMMMVDGELDEQELAICKLYAMALGYRGSIVDGMIAGVIDNLDAEDNSCDE